MAALGAGLALLALAGVPAWPASALAWRGDAAARPGDAVAWRGDAVAWRGDARPGPGTPARPEDVPAVPSAGARPGPVPAGFAPVRPRPGEPVAHLAIPKLGAAWTVVEGVDEASLATAPGHYPQTAMPGEVGNFAVAAHRARGLFWDLDRLERGDTIVVDRRLTYTVTGTRVVAPTAVEVLAPVPGAPRATATAAALTLTTCDPRWSDAHRLVVLATLDHPGKEPTR
ncbi:hypothetical protein Asi02nite_76230 [Asanoa siamensis]|uniref:Sortase A n=1 Tax=Asanoa siamensis TaxID=926357 RepID=A0ABQ4D3J3_9ACTN|nr:hypothetical protein Asi02nite_76230 [Asanoa siamensis]